MCTKCKNKALKMAGIGKTKRRNPKRKTSRRGGIGEAAIEMQSGDYMDLLMRAAGAAASAVAVNPIMTAVLKAMKKTEADVPHIKHLIKIGLGYVALTQAPQRGLQLMGSGAIIMGIIEFLQSAMPDVFAPKAIKGLYEVGATEPAYIQLTNEDIHGVEEYIGGSTEDTTLVFA